MCLTLAGLSLVTQLMCDSVAWKQNTYNQLCGRLELRKEHYSSNYFLKPPRKPLRYGSTLPEPDTKLSAKEETDEDTVIQLILSGLTAQLLHFSLMIQYCLLTGIAFLAVIKISLCAQLMERCAECYI